MTFDRAVFWSGIWNVGLGLILVTPPAREFLGLQVPNPFWPSIVAAFLWYTAATLILSSRDIQVLASVIYWEALLRLRRWASLSHMASHTSACCQPCCLRSPTSHGEFFT